LHAQPEREGHHEGSHRKRRQATDRFRNRRAPQGTRNPHRPPYRSEIPHAARDLAKFPALTTTLNTYFKHFFYLNTFFGSRHLRAPPRLSALNTFVRTLKTLANFLTTEEVYPDSPLRNLKGSESRRFCASRSPTR